MTLRDASSLGSSGTTDWQRLDPRMLFVHPLTELRKLLVPLIGVVLFGTSVGGGPFAAVAAIGIPVVIGVVRYLTTSYRIGDGRVELQRGLLSRQRLSTPLDRVRTVDLTASLVHRVLGLTTVAIGTGTAATDAGDRLELDALATTQAVALRDRLLAASPADQAAGTAPAGGVLRPEPVAAFAPRWLWYAPFTNTGLVVAGGALGAAAQLLEGYDPRVDLDEADVAAPAGALVAAAVVGLLLLVLVITVVGYLVVNWRLTLTRLNGAWHLRRGLLTTRETSIDVERVAGVAIGEQAGLRLARGARLSAIVTGLDRTESGSEVLVPPAPQEVVRRAGAAVLGIADPITAPLSGHGPAATRRRFTRALLPAGAVAVAGVGLVLAGLSAWLLVVPVLALAAALALAVDRARSLGHALVDGHLVARSGSLLRRREILAHDHVIGWTLRDTWFQRRVGLTTLVATTAGGSGAVAILDVPEHTAVAVADAAVPALVAQFRG